MERKRGEVRSRTKREEWIRLEVTYDQDVAKGKMVDCCPVEDLVVCYMVVLVVAPLAVLVQVEDFVVHQVL